MATAVALFPTSTSTPSRPAPTADRAVPPPPVRTLRLVVAATGDVVAGLALDDHRWTDLGPLLTRVVHTTRLAAGLRGSPIGPDEAVSPVLRLRDLARLAQDTTASQVLTTPAVDASLRALLVAASR